MVDISSVKELFLHGDLHLQIIEARNLPNMDVLAGHILRCVSFDSRPKDTPSGSGDLKQRSKGRKFITSDPWVKVSIPDQAVIARTSVLKNTENPLWNQWFNIPLAHSFSHLKFEVKDQDLIKGESLGMVHIPAEKIATGKTIFGWFPLMNSRKESALRLELKFIPCEKNPIYQYGIAGDPETKGVRGTYFPVRKGSQVTLYQDAHIRPESNMPKIELDDGKVFEHNSCWEDICHAVSSATKMIYIVGWSIFHRVKLVREPTRPLPRGGDLTLGELLKHKSQEGVRVLLLVWDDITSYSNSFVKTAGMKTHDEETRKFFKHSSVVCVLSPRYGNKKQGHYKEQTVKGAFSHHQKCVIVDTQAHGNNRKITAFIGGLDLSDGRYDTPEHRLFHNLDTVFEDDIHQPAFPAGTKAPRQPWHDLHCKIDGHAAYDVLLNFEQRWRKATKWPEIASVAALVGRSQVGILLKINEISWILSPKYQIPPNGNYTVVPEDDPLLHVSREDDPDNWHVQIFRSIDSGSVKGFPKTADVVQEQNLVTSKSMVVEKSIQTAYIQAIRSAQHFIYIENQYFIGSSFKWPSYEKAGANNLIPMELAQKIASKIRSKERFAVYVVIPMWPEGDPTSLMPIMQDILCWQSHTMQMMYNVVALAIKSMQMNAHPKDYLNFYCLGKREDLPFNFSPSLRDEKISDSLKFKRFMIYVHSKGMIVDDEYVIVGSANINERSMAGSGDTEIAMGSYQPHHTWAAKKRHPYGQVYGYRMSLWAEHLGAIENAYKEPQTLACVNKVNKIAEDNWKRYTSEKHTVLQGHLLRYPLHVDADGKVNPLPGYEKFPDIGLKVMGSQSPMLPEILTT